MRCSAGRGWNRGIIERALSQISSDDEAERAAQLVARKRRSLRVPRQSAYRLVSMLARKKAGSPSASNAVRDALMMACW